MPSPSVVRPLWLWYPGLKQRRGRTPDARDADCFELLADPRNDYKTLSGGTSPPRVRERRDGVLFSADLSYGTVRGLPPSPMSQVSPLSVPASELPRITQGSRSPFHSNGHQRENRRRHGHALHQAAHLACGVVKRPTCNDRVPHRVKGPIQQNTGRQPHSCSLLRMWVILPCAVRGYEVSVTVTEEPTIPLMGTLLLGRWPSADS